MNLSEIAPKEIMPGYHGKIVHGERMSVVFWEVAQGAEVPQHQHDHEQIMHVMEGTFEFTVNNHTQNYEAGDIVIIPSNQPHKGKALTACKLMDFFAPARTEY